MMIASHLDPVTQTCLGLTCKPLYAIYGKMNLGISLSSVFDEWEEYLDSMNPDFIHDDYGDTYEWAGITLGILLEEWAGGLRFNILWDDTYNDSDYNRPAWVTERIFMEIEEIVNENAYEEGVMQGEYRYNLGRRQLEEAKEEEEREYRERYGYSDEEEEEEEEDSEQGGENGESVGDN